MSSDEQTEKNQHNLGIFFTQIKNTIKILFTRNHKINSDLESKKQLAIAEDTPEEVLRELSKYNDITIRQAVASNPNSPVEALENLSEEFPEIVIANPIFDLLFLENSESEFIKLILARSSTTPTAKLVKLIDSCIEDDFYVERDIIKAAIANPNINLEILEILENIFEYPHQQDDINTAIARNPNASSAMLDRILKNSSSNFYFSEICCEVIKHPNTSAKTIDRIVEEINVNNRDNSAQIYRSIVKHPNTSADALEKLPYDEKKLRIDALKHPNISAYGVAIIQFIEGKIKPSYDLLKKLATHPHKLLRQSVAKCPDVTMDILEQLVKDKKNSIRKAICDNPKTSAEILDMVFDYHNKYDVSIRYQIVEHPNTSSLTLEKLATHKDNNIRRKVLKHPHVSNYAIKLILLKENLSHQKILWNEAKLNLDRDLWQKLIDSHAFIHLLIAKTPDISTDIIEMSATKIFKKSLNHNIYDIEELISHHPNASAKVLDLLLDHINKHNYFYHKTLIFRNISKHSNTSSSALEKLATYGDAEVRLNVLKHPNTSDFAISIIKFIQIKLQDSEPNIFDRSTTIECHEMRRLVARHPDTPSSILLRLSQHKDKYTRQGVATNCNTPLNILEKLANDSCDRVRSGVAMNPSISLEIIDKLSLDKSPKVRIKIAQKQPIAEKIFITLAADYSKRVRIEVARNNHTSSKILEQLSKDKDVLVRQAVARNNYTPLVILNKLSQEKIESIQRSACKKIVQHPQATPEMFEKILEYTDNDDLGEICCAILKHCNISAQIIEAIVNRVNNCYIRTEVYRQIVNHPKTSTYALERLPYDKKKLRVDALKHPNISAYAIAIIKFVEGEIKPDYALFQELANHRHQFVRKLVVKHPDVPMDILEQLAQDDCYSVKEAICSNHKTSLEILENIFNQFQDSWQEHYISLAIAQNPKASSVMLDRILALKTKGDPTKIYHQIVRHPNASTSALEKLAIHQDKNIRLRVLEHPHVSKYATTIIKFTQGKLKPDYTLWQKLYDNSNDYIRLLIAQNTDTPADILQQLSEDKDDHVRKAIARNNRTPLAILNKLSQDKIKFVNRAANRSIIKRIS